LGAYPTMSIIRVTKQKNFSIISNVALNDENLSLKAKGLWAYLLSKPDDWQIRVSHLVKTCKDGRDSIYSTLRELKECGYVEMIEHKDEQGKFTSYEYLVNEEPKALINHADLAEKPNTEKPNTEKPNTEKPTLLITDRIPLVKTENNEQRLTEPAVVAVNKENPKAEKKDTDNKLELDLLVKMIPTKHQTPLVIKFIEQKLSDGVNVEELKACILYVKDKAKGNSSQFKSYIGKCLDNKWACGYLEEFESERLKKQEQEAHDAMKSFIEAQERRAKLDAEEEARAKAKADDDEIKAILETVDIADLDNWIETHHLESRNSFEKKKWKLKERYITRRLLVRDYLKQKLLGA
jgi:hypothetical protein